MNRRNRTNDILVSMTRVSATLANTNSSTLQNLYNDECDERDELERLRGKPKSTDAVLFDALIKIPIRNLHSN